METGIFAPAKRTAHRAAPGTLRVALAGCGVVGTAFLREIEAQRHRIAERHGLALEITGVLVRDAVRDRGTFVDQRKFTSDVDAFLALDSDVVVETIGGLDPAQRLATHALERGRAVVTANKALLAACGTRLSSLAASSGTSLRYDAAVGGGVPVLRMLDDALGGGGATAVRGILNGTSNFVLGCLERGASLAEALQEALAAGFSERDATRDLDGRDSADKIALVAWAAFGVPPEQLVVHRQSLLPCPERYVALAARLGLRVKHVSECALVDGRVIARVEPLLVHERSAFAQTNDERNHVEVDAGWRSPLCASGPGAGGAPTATALVSDLLSTGARSSPTATTCSGLPDPRVAAWALEIRGAPSVLHHSVPDCGLVATDASATAAWTTIARASRQSIDILLRQLDALNVHPIVARFDESCCRTEVVR